MTEDDPDSVGCAHDALVWLLPRAWLLASAGFLRCWCRLLDIHAAHSSSLASLLTGAAGLTGAERLRLVDELRVVLREIGDLSFQEARRLQHELELLGDALAHAATGGTESASPAPRRHEVKP